MKLSVSGQFDLPRLHPDTAVVVALDPGSFAADEHPRVGAQPDVLRLAMHDLHTEDDPWGEAWTPPREGQVAELLSWLDRVRPTRLHVACHAGISRSTALAAAALSHLCPGLSDAEVIAEVLRVRPGCFPNPLILAHTDRLTGRDLIGALEAALGEYVRAEPKELF